jgi:hypothetical protein
MNKVLEKTRSNKNLRKEKVVLKLKSSNKSNKNLELWDETKFQIPTQYH